MNRCLLAVSLFVIASKLFSQPLLIKDIIDPQSKYYAILDTTGIAKVDSILSELKKSSTVKEVLLAGKEDFNNISMKEKLSNQNIILAGLFIKDNIIWKVLNKGAYLVTRERFGSIPPNAGLKCVGENPAGNGFAVVYTSNTLLGLKEILSFKENESSFYAVMNGKVAESLLLNSSFNIESFTTFDLVESPKIELAKAIDDMNFFFNTLQSVHPQPLKNILPNDYLNLKKRIADTLVVLDKSNDLTIADLSMLLAEAAEKIKDGHTSLLPQVKNPKLAKMPPFRMKYDNGKILIAKAINEASAYSGSEVLKINNKALEEFFAPVFNMISGEKNIFKWSRFISSQDKYLAVKNIFNTEDAVLTLKDNNGNIIDVHIKPVDIAAYAKIPIEKQKVLSNNFEFLNDGKTALFHYNSFVLSDKEKALVDSLFKLMNVNKTKNLIIDLRDNGGGNSGMGDYIISYLTSKPYCMFGRMDVKLSKEILAAGADKEYTGLEGLTITHNSELTEPEEREHKFAGKTIVLASNNTFSSAADFTAVIKDFFIGTIIGSETGGMRQCFGDVFSFETPNSKISFGVSYKVFYAPVPKPGDEYHGTIPDIEISDELLKDYTKSNDPILDFTLDYLEK